MKFAAMIASAALAVASARPAAEAPYVNAWAGVRGANYVPSYSRNPIQTWRDYNGSTVLRELGFARKLGLNAVRVFLHMFPWVENRTSFLANYDHFVAGCAAAGIRPLVVLFDDDFMDAPGVTSVAQINPWLATGAYKNSSWLANPGMPLVTADAAAGWPTETALLRDVVGGSRANDSRLLGFDIMNEPHRSGLSDFITHAFAAVQAETNVLTTVDAFGEDTVAGERMERGLSYHSYWEYGRPDACAPQSAQVCRDQHANGMSYYASGEQANKPVLVSEMGQFDCYCPAASGFQGAGVGWIAWELMLEHDQFSSFQGLVYKNGTARNATEAACLAALANNPRPVCPHANLPGCPPSNCSSVADTNTSFLVYTPPSTPKPFSCWTAWAGAGPPDGTVHYCKDKGATVTFVAPPNAGVDLVYKSGPDCGVMNVTVGGDAGGGARTVDTFSPSVDWTTVLRLGAVPAGATVGVTVTGKINPKSSDGWVQITGVNVFSRAQPQ